MCIRDSVESARDAGCSWRDVLCRIILPLTYKDVIVSATFILMGQVDVYKRQAVYVALTAVSCASNPARREPSLKFSHKNRAVSPEPKSPGRNIRS